MDRKGFLKGDVAFRKPWWPTRRRNTLISFSSHPLLSSHRLSAAKSTHKSTGKGICWSSPSESASQHTEQVGQVRRGKQMVQHTDQTRGRIRDDNTHQECYMAHSTFTQTLIINWSAFARWTWTAFTILNTEPHLESVNLWDDIGGGCHLLPS